MFSLLWMRWCGGAGKEAPETGEPSRGRYGTRLPDTKRFRGRRTKSRGRSGNALSSDRKCTTPPGKIQAAGSGRDPGAAVRPPAAIRIGSAGIPISCGARRRGLSAGIPAPRLTAPFPLSLRLPALRACWSGGLSSYRADFGPAGTGTRFRRASFRLKPLICLFPHGLSNLRKIPAG